MNKEFLIKTANDLNLKILEKELIGTIWVTIGFEKNKEVYLTITFFYSNSNFTVYLYEWENREKLKQTKKYIDFILDNMSNLHKIYVKQELFKKYKDFKEYIDEKYYKKEN